MKEEVLTKAIGLKKELDSKRELLKFANSGCVDLRVNLEERCYRGRNRNVSGLLDDSVIEELKAKVIANIEKSINELLEKLEKL